MKIGFIHIPKSGGTALKSYLKNNNEIEFIHWHNADEKYFCKRNKPCFAIIREPVSRFYSLFYYNKYGGDKRRKRFGEFNTINEYVDHLRSLDKSGVQNEFFKIEKGYQFKRQSNYLNGNKSNLLLIKYDKENLLDNIKIALKIIFDIDIKLNNVEKKNETKYTNKEILSPDNEKWVRNYYKDDVNLYGLLEDTNFFYYNKNGMNNIKEEDKPLQNTAPVKQENKPVQNTVPVKNTAPIKKENKPVQNNVPVKIDNKPVQNTAPVKIENKPVQNTAPVKIENKPVQNTAPIKQENKTVQNNSPKKVNNKKVPAKKENDNDMGFDMLKNILISQIGNSMIPKKENNNEVGLDLLKDLNFNFNNLSDQKIKKNKGNPPQKYELKDTVHNIITILTAVETIL